MIPIIICVVLSGVITLFLIAPIMQSRPRTCYMLMVLIPMASLTGAFAVFPVKTPPPHNNTPLAVPEQSEMHIKLGEFSLAIALLTQFIDENGQNEAISLQLGRAYFAKGLLHAEHNEKSAALENLKQAMDISPSNALFIADLQHFITKVNNMEQKNKAAE